MKIMVKTLAWKSLEEKGANELEARLHRRSYGCFLFSHPGRLDYEVDFSRKIPFTSFNSAHGGTAGEVS